MLRTIMFLVGTLIMGGTENAPENHIVIAGRYSLYDGRNSHQGSADNAVMLVIGDTGNFTLTCSNSENNPVEVSGKWSLKNGYIQFSDFIDCVNVWPAQVGNRGASLPIQRHGADVMIMLSDELNVFFHQLKN